jgi:hypothetical protein
LLVFAFGVARQQLFGISDRLIDAFQKKISMIYSEAQGRAYLKRIAEFSGGPDQYAILPKRINHFRSSRGIWNYSGPPFDEVQTDK